MKKILKFLIILILIGLLFIGLDSGTALLKKTAPFIHWSADIENGKVDKTLFYDMYYCYNREELESTNIVFKGKSFTCPEGDTILTSENLNVYSYKGFFNRKTYLKTITSLEELKEAVKYIKPFNKKYDPEFFDKKTIILVYIPAEENAVVSFKQIRIREDVTVSINFDKSKADRDSTTGYAIFIEIDKEYLGDKEINLES